MPDALNAEPRANAAFPGVLGAVALPHVWLGCPVCVGPSIVGWAIILAACPGPAAFAAADATSGMALIAAIVVNSFMAVLLRGFKGRVAGIGAA